MKTLRQTLNMENLRWYESLMLVAFAATLAGAGAFSALSYPWDAYALIATQMCALTTAGCLWYGFRQRRHKG